jgi:predicted enzyme related to lactoylglutathione lyase
VVLRLGDSLVALSTPGPATQAGLEPSNGNPLELVIWCDDVDAQIERLRADGTSIVVEPYDHAAGHRRAYVADPDGNWLALVDAPVPS